MTKLEKQWWEQERAKGYDYFVLRSLFRAGLPFGILMVLTHVLWTVFNHQPIPPIWKLLVQFGFYVVGFGGWMGIWRWQSNERAYKNPTEDDDVH